MVYRASSLRGLAITQLVFGGLMIIFGAACIISVHQWSSYVGFGIWVGIWVLISGILGYIGAKDDANPNKCLIGSFMGFSITACCITAIMFICYCIALGQFSQIIRCRNSIYHDYYEPNWYDGYCYTRSQRYTAAVGAGLGSCLLIFSIVVFFVALASSIYCCNAICCGATTVGSVTTTQQVMYLQTQQMYPGGQPGMVVIQPSGAIATVPHGYPIAGQQAVYIPPQPVPMQQPAGYWAVPPGSMPPGSMPPGSMPHAGMGATVPNQARAQEAMKEQERPPPYSYMQTGNAPAAPPSVSASGAAASEDVPGAMAV